MDRFANETILVTGGAGGQGEAEVRLLAAEGARVVIGDVLEEQGKAVAESLGGRASFPRLDVSSEADWQTIIKVCEGSGGPHGLVNNAGVYQPARLKTPTSR